MIKAEVVDNSTTASDNKDEKTNNETVVVEPLTNSHNNTNVQMPDIIPTSIELDSIQINNKTINKQNKVLFDLDKKQQDDNNNIRRNSNASNVSSKRAITTYNNNNKKTSLDCHRKSTQVEINMDSIVVAKSATNSNNNRNPINNRLRNIIEILRNTFNTSNPSSSSNQTKKNNKSKQKSIQASNNQKQITAPTNTNNEIKSINNNNNNTNKTKETKLNNMTDDDLSVCQLCFNICCMKNKEDGTNYMYDLDTCDHSFCIDCLRLYLKYQIIESRVSISCPQCSEKMHPNDIYRLLSLTNLITTIDNIPTDSLNYLNTITGMKATTTLNNNTPSPLTTSSSSASSTSSSSEIQSTNKKLLPNSIDTASKTLSCSNENKQKKITDSNLSQIKPATPTTTRKQQQNQLPALNLHEQQQNWPTLIQKYEEFMLRRVLVTIPDTRWCPAPDCTYAVIASGCANCPQLFCMRPECNTSFCYHCKQYWHPNLTCEDAAMRNNQSPIGILINLDNNNNNNGQTSTNKLIRSILQRSNSHISTGSSSMGGINTTTNGLSSTSAGPRIAGSGGMDLIKEEIKRCPKCQALIVKMDDGSCNHITCAVCGCEFCWLCMKEISDLHYLSPSGCTFWGKKPWSRKKKILWQLGILIGAPVGIALIAGVAVPAILIGLPIWSGRKVYVRYKTLGKHKRNLIVLGTVSGTVLVAPLVAALAVAIGVPILLAYVYGVVPISLCRSGGCGVTTNNNGGVRFAFDDETADNLNFFYNNTNNNEPNVNSNNNNNNKNNKKQINNTPTSVKVPISAIESKPDNILMVRSSPPSSLHVTTPHITMTTTNNNNNNTAEDSITNSNDSNHLRPHTPVLVTITVANKSTKTLSNNSVLLSTNGSSGTNKHQKMKRIKSATSTSSSSILKESTEKKKTHHHHHHHKSSKTTSFTNKNVTSIATTCGSVELIKLNKTNNEFNLNSDDNDNSKNKNTTLNNNNQNEIKIKSIAAELVNETAPMSSITTPRCKLNNTTNTTSDLENNLSSSSSSHHLINESTCTNNNNNNKQQQQQQIENKENIYLNKITKSGSKNKQKKMNPSIGEVSIGAYTNTSMSADMMDDNGEDEYDETNTNNKKYDELDDDDANSNFQLDQENSSTKAIASGSIKKYSIDQSNQLNSTTDIKMKLNKTDSKAVDTYSVSIISEKSINPSVTALAGSIKDNQSVENLNLVDDIISASVQTK